MVFLWLPILSAVFPKQNPSPSAGASVRQMSRISDNFLRRKEMPNLRKLALILTVVVALALTPKAGGRQNVYSSITGVVPDASGAAIGSASVTLTNMDTQEKRTIESVASGDYS